MVMVQMLSEGEAQPPLPLRERDSLQAERGRQGEGAPRRLCDSRSFAPTPHPDSSLTLQNRSLSLKGRGSHADHHH